MSGAIVINKDTSYKIKVQRFTTSDDIENFKNSLFYDVYEKSADFIKEIAANTEKYHEVLKNYKDNILGCSIMENESFNNIIAFTGDRGTGKSSAMVSFMGLLNSLRDTKSLEGLDNFKHLKNYNFVPLDIIDPSMLEDEENIVGIVISKMFLKFKEYCEDSKNNKSENKKRELAKKFKEVYENIRTISMSHREIFRENEYSETAIETLSKLALGSNMRRSLIELIMEYTELFSDGGQEENSFLVIAIDDLDMSISSSERIVEQIRKYLIIPNVVILMAVKIEQLINSIEQKYIENYKTIIEQGIFTDDIKSMAEKYVTKLIPHQRRLKLPSPRINNNEKVKLIVIDDYE